MTVLDFKNCLQCAIVHKIAALRSLPCQVLQLLQIISKYLQIMTHLFALLAWLTNKLGHTKSEILQIIASGVIFEAILSKFCQNQPDFEQIIGFWFLKSTKRAFAHRYKNGFFGHFCQFWFILGQKQQKRAFAHSHNKKTFNIGRSKILIYCA